MAHRRQEDIVLRGLLGGGSAQFYAVSARDSVAEAKEIHDCSATCTAALGRALMATFMLQSMEKEATDRDSLLISGGGPAGNIVCVGRFEGDRTLVKGYIANPQVELPPRADGKLNVGAAVGCDGTLTVIRDLGMKEPYVGKSQMVSGEIAEDVSHYFLHSQQQPSAVYLGVHISRDFSVKAAAGLIIQLLPGCEETVIAEIERLAPQFPQLADSLEGETTLEEALNTLLGALQPEALEERKVAFACDCSKERVAGALVAVGSGELTKMIEEDRRAELTCHFCDKKYLFSKEELASLLETALS